MKTYYLYIFTGLKGDRYATVSVGKKEIKSRSD